MIGNGVGKSVVRLAPSAPRAPKLFIATFQDRMRQECRTTFDSLRPLAFPAHSPVPLLNPPRLQLHIDTPSETPAEGHLAPNAPRTTLPHEGHEAHPVSNHALRSSSLPGPSALVLGIRSSPTGKARGNCVCGREAGRRSLHKNRWRRQRGHRL